MLISAGAPGAFLMQSSSSGPTNDPGCQTGCKGPWPQLSQRFCVLSFCYKKLQFSLRLVVQKIIGYHFLIQWRLANLVYDLTNPSN